MADDSVDDGLLRASNPGVSAPTFFATPTEEAPSGPSAFGADDAVEATNDFLTSDLTYDGSDDTGDDSVNAAFAAALDDKPRSSRPATPTMNINASLLEDDDDDEVVAVTAAPVVAEEVVATVEVAAPVEDAPVAVDSFPAPTDEPEDPDVPEDATAPEAETVREDDAPKKKSSKKVLIYGLVVAIVAAGGAAAYSLLG